MMDDNADHFPPPLFRAVRFQQNIGEQRRLEPSVWDGGISRMSSGFGNLASGFPARELPSWSSWATLLLALPP